MLLFLHKISQLLEDIRAFMGANLAFINNFRDRNLLKQHKKLVFGVRMT